MVQQELFGTGRIQGLKRKVKELDGAISKALKQKDFAKAKDLTDQQSKILKELLDPREPL